MAITPKEARTFSPDEAEFLYQFERHVDLFVRTIGLIKGETTLTYPITGEEKGSLTDKTMSEAVRRYNNAGWNASFTFAGNSNNPKEFILVDPNGG